MEQALLRYTREVKGYTATFQKQEFTGGRLHPTEVMDIAFREQPHSVYMEWKKGTQQAERVLYVEGENDDKLLARPSGALARTVAGDIVSRDVEGPDARTGNRYTLREFGLKRTTERTLIDWRAAKKADDLNVEYQGKKKLKEAGDRLCYTFHRVCKKPDKYGVADATMYFDTENWLQIGTVLKDEKGNLLGSYYFRDLKLNPDFKADQFQKTALKP
jgi:outer membrane lipoprotein-sorting protein